MDREQERQRYQTISKDGHVTFDYELYYNEMPLDGLIELRNNTIASLERYPNFGTQFYTDFIAYLNGKINERKDQTIS